MEQILFDLTKLVEKAMLEGRYKVYKGMEKSLTHEVRKNGKWVYTGLCEYLARNHPIEDEHRMMNISDLPELRILKPPPMLASWWFHPYKRFERLVVVRKAILRTIYLMKKR